MAAMSVMRTAVTPSTAGSTDRCSSSWAEPGRFVVGHVPADGTVTAEPTPPPTVVAVIDDAALVDDRGPDLVALGPVVDVAGATDVDPDPAHAVTATKTTRIVTRRPRTSARYGEVSSPPWVSGPAHTECVPRGALLGAEGCDVRWQSTPTAP
jgi:hypothetical protein